MAQLKWTREAQHWLQDIHEHIALDNPAAARRTIEALISKAELLLDHPDLGYRHPASAGDVRILLHEHYRIVYRNDAAGVVTIVGVYHGALDLQRYLDRTWS